MNKEQVLHYLYKGQACDSALAGLLVHEGTLEDFYNGCQIDWRIWLHNSLGLDPEPYQQYNAVTSPAYMRYANDEITHAKWCLIEAEAWQKWKADTMKDWAVVEKALQAAIDSS